MQVWPIANQLVNIWARIKGDVPSKIAIVFMRTGVGLLTGGGIGYGISLKYISSEGKTLEVAFDLGDVCAWIAFTGAIFLATGFVVALIRYCILTKREGIVDTALFFFCGFDNMNDQIPRYSLPKNIQRKVSDIDFGKIDSYTPKRIIEKYQFYSEIVKERIRHSDCTSAFIAALGSVPYLYLIGTMFRNGNISLQVLDHDRKEDRWHQLDILGEPRKLIFNIGNTHGKDEVLAVLKTNQWDDVGVAISFTNEILVQELPEPLSNQTVFLRLDTDFKYDALPCESQQDAIIEQMSHFLTSISKHTTRIHLFICAQASVVVKLGRFFQDGMVGEVVIHNYNAQSKTYPWALTFNGSTPSEYQSCEKAAQ